jgi:transcriptional regulator with XRE-family HTH domain
MQRKSRGTPIDKQIGNRLRQLRIDRGLTQSALGKALGITFQQIQKYEMGTNAIASSRMPALCKALAINSDELYKLDVQIESVGTVKVAAMKTALRLEKLKNNQRGIVNSLIEVFERENDDRKSNGNGRTVER